MDLTDDELIDIVDQDFDRIIEIFNLIKRSRRNEYHKKYYLEHKQKMILQTLLNQDKRRLKKILTR